MSAQWTNLRVDRRGQEVQRIRLRIERGERRLAICERHHDEGVEDGESEYGSESRWEDKYWPTLASFWFIQLKDYGLGEIDASSRDSSRISASLST